MAAFKYNYGQAFTLFSQNNPLEEVAEMCQIPIEKLKEHAGREGWTGLVKSIQGYHAARNELVQALPPEEKKNAIAKLQANRDANFAQADMLRQVAYKTIEHWLSVVSEPDEEGRIGLIDARNLKEMANALATIHELTYRALGDCAAKTTSGPDRPSGSPQITINLPGVLVNPRGSKTIDVRGSDTTTGSVEAQ